MPVVAEKQLQCMLTGAQRKFDLRLTSSEVQVIEVTRDFLIQARQRSVNEKVMVAAIGPRICCGGYFYPTCAEAYDRVGCYSCAILQAQEENFGTGRGRGSLDLSSVALGWSCCRGKNKREDRYEYG